MGAAALAMAALALLPPAARADTVVPDDQIVQGSQCIGLDCVNNESFGFTTLMLKENNNRLLFNDTSTSAGLPTTNWALIANGNLSGDPNFFGLANLGDTDTNTQNPSVYPFKVAGGAGNNALSVNASGNVGIGTGDASRTLQLTRGDTPVMRLDQDNSSGFSPQVWDVAGNETNFFVRDATNGNLLPFRIRPGAPTSSIDIAANGNVGIGLNNPNAPLDIQRGNGTAKVRVAETNGTTQLRELVALINNGPSTIRLENTSAGTHPVWLAGTDDADDYLLDTDGSTVAPLRVSSAGGLYSGADPAQRTDVQQVDPAAVLNQIASLPLRTWVYADDADGGRHIGPTASEFRSASGLGPSSDAIAPADVGGVALAGVQALNAKIAGGAVSDEQAKLNAQFKKQIKKLQKQNKKLTKRVKKLEKK
ncbi:MAG: hypothetical protein U0R24_04010 [Solirubrobacterales bacterium]